MSTLGLDLSDLQKIDYVTWGQEGNQVSTEGFPEAQIPPPGFCGTMTHLSLRKKDGHVPSIPIPACCTAGRTWPTNSTSPAG